MFECARERTCRLYGRGVGPPCGQLSFLLPYKRQTRSRAYSNVGSGRGNVAVVTALLPSDNYSLTECLSPSYRVTITPLPSTYHTLAEWRLFSYRVTIARLPIAYLSPAKYLSPSYRVAIACLMSACCFSADC